MSNSNNSSNGGLGLMSVLFLVFLTLKLTGFIDWSWWYVTMPLWGGLALVVVITLTCALYVATKTACKKVKK